MTNIKKPILLLGVVLLIVIAYSNSFKGVFFYDDKILIPGGFIRSLNFNEVFGVACGQTFPDGSNRGVLYRPTLILSYFIDHKLWQNNAAGYHLTNLLFHTLNCLLLFYIAKIFSNSNTFSFIAAALFALHPIQVEAVTWIAGRNELLLTFFTLSALALYINRRIAWSSAAFLLALFTKESAMLLLPLFILYDVCFPTNTKRSTLNYTGFAIMAILYLSIRYFAIGSLEAGAAGTLGHFIGSIVTAPLYYLNYLKLFFYPDGYSFTPTLLFAHHLKYLYIILTVTIFLAAIAAFRRSRILVFGSLWFLIALLPCTGIFPMPWPLMEHRIYLPSVGIFLCIAYGIDHLMKSSAKIVRVSALSLLALLIIFSSLATYQRNGIFSSELAIWRSTAQNDPGSAIAKKFLKFS